MEAICSKYWKALFWKYEDIDYNVWKVISGSRHLQFTWYVQVLLALDNIVLGSFLKNSSLQPNKCQNVVYIIFQHDFIEIVPTIKANNKMFEWAIKRDEFSATFLSLSSAMKSSFSRAEIFCITSLIYLWICQQFEFGCTTNQSFAANRGVNYRTFSLL